MAKVATEVAAASSLQKELDLAAVAVKVVAKVVERRA